MFLVYSGYVYSGLAYSGLASSSHSSGWSSFAIRWCVLLYLIFFSSVAQEVKMYPYLCRYYVFSSFYFCSLGFKPKIYSCLCFYRVFLLVTRPQTWRYIIIYFPIIFSCCQSVSELRCAFIYVYILCS